MEDVHVTLVSAQPLGPRAFSLLVSVTVDMKSFGAASTRGGRRLQQTSGADLADAVSAAVGAEASATPLTPPVDELAALEAAMRGQWQLLETTNSVRSHPELERGGLGHHLRLVNHD